MSLLLLLFACAEVDPDATGARWDTATDKRPTTTDPVPLSVVDTGASVAGDTAGDPGLCLGDGEPRVRIGDGGLSFFTPFQDGERLELTTGPSGGLGLHLDLLSEGLDTSGSMNVILRLALEGNATVAAAQEDYLALVRMQCPRPGPGWVQVFAALPEQLQDAAAQGQLEGMAGSLALSLVDKHREEDTVRVDIVLR
jgi:hypothetical protein